MVKNKILSVCIPTYNRGMELRQRLREIENQISCLNYYSKLEIIISDNNYSDDTEKIVNKCIKEYSKLNIKYYKNSKNIGYGKNINRLIELAKCEYIWLCGDDDSINENAFLKLFKILEEKKPDYLILNSSNYDIRNNKITSKNIIDEVGNRYIDSAKILEKYFGIIVFIGSNVFKRELANKAVTKLSGKVSDVYQNSIISFLILNNIESAYVSSFLYVQDKLGNKNYTIRQFLDIPILEYIRMKEIVLWIDDNSVFLTYLDRMISTNIKYYSYEILLWKIFRNKNIISYYLEILKKRDILTKKQLIMVSSYVTASLCHKSILKFILLVFFDTSKNQMGNTNLFTA